MTGTGIRSEAPSGLLVLVVEDERIISLALASMLRTLGHRVAGCVASGEEALASLELLKPDLVLLDIHLEGDLDGIATAQAIRERQGPPVAFTSAYTDAATRERALAVGPLAFLPKPLGAGDIGKLVAGLAKLDAQRAAQPGS